MPQPTWRTPLRDTAGAEAKQAPASHALPLFRERDRASGARGCAAPGVANVKGQPAAAEVLVKKLLEKGGDAW